MGRKRNPNSYMQRAQDAVNAMSDELVKSGLPDKQIRRALNSNQATAAKIKDLDKNWKPKYDDLVRWSHAHSRSSD